MARVLIVDDAKFLRLTLSNIMAKGSHEVIGEAVNGKQGVELFEKLRPDIVTMDITMPEMTGIEAIKKIKEIDPKAKIIICSSIGREKLIVEAIEAGAKDFIVKPFEEGSVLEAIRRVID